MVRCAFNIYSGIQGAASERAQAYRRKTCFCLHEACVLVGINEESQIKLCHTSGSTLPSEDRDRHWGCRGAGAGGRLQSAMASEDTAGEKAVTGGPCRAPEAGTEMEHPVRQYTVHRQWGRWLTFP